MISAGALLADAQRLVKRLEADLRERVSAEPAVERLLRERHAAAKRGQRTGVPFETWRDQQLTQVAAGWVLACVFTRFCEDNRLLPDPWLAGPGDRLVEARERQTAWFRDHPAGSDLDYLSAAVDRLAEFPATAALVDRHNPRHVLSPTPDAATALLDAWRRVAPETGRIAHDFTDPEWGARFLGDLYQDLSEQARKDYALLQTRSSWRSSSSTGRSTRLLTSSGWRKRP
jgi:hypothetical protein